MEFLLAPNLMRERDYEREKSGSRVVLKEEEEVRIIEKD